MKKLLFAGAVLGCASFAFAEDSCSGDFAPGHGFYIAGGIVGVDAGGSADYIDHESYVLDLAAASGNATADDAGIAARKAHYNSLKFDETDLYSDANRKYKGGVLHPESKYSNTKVGGSLLIGYQHVFNEYPICLGIEFGADFTARSETLEASKTTYITTTDGDTRKYDATLGRSGCNPFAAIRIGYVHAGTLMPYFKVGVSRVETKETYDEFDEYGKVDDYSGHLKMSSWKPTLALGVEKALTDGVTGRLEFEYRFPKKKNKNFSEEHWYEMNEKDTLGVGQTKAAVCKFAAGEKNGRLEVKEKGAFTVRALISYNVKI